MSQRTRHTGQMDRRAFLTVAGGAAMWAALSQVGLAQATSGHSRNDARQGPRSRQDGHPLVQRHPVWRLDGGSEALHGAGQGGSVDRRTRGGALRPSVASEHAVHRGAGSTGGSGRGVRRGLPQPERVDARDQRRAQAAGHVLVSRRRLRAGERELAVDRRRVAGAPRRCRGRDRQPSPHGLRLPPSGRRRWGEIRVVWQRRHAGPRARARMGPRQHQRVWWRSRQRLDLRRIGWWREGVHAADDAGRERAVPPRGNSERRQFAFGHARGGQRVDQGVARSPAASREPYRRAADHADSSHPGSHPRRAALDRVDR